MFDLVMCAFIIGLKCLFIVLTYILLLKCCPTLISDVMEIGYLKLLESILYVELGFDSKFVFNFNVD